MGEPRGLKAAPTEQDKNLPGQAQFSGTMLAHNMTSPWFDSQN